MFNVRLFYQDRFVQSWIHFKMELANRFERFYRLPAYQIFFNRAYRELSSCPDKILRDMKVTRGEILRLAHEEANSKFQARQDQ